MREQLGKTASEEEVRAAAVDQLHSTMRKTQLQAGRRRNVLDRMQQR